MEKVETTKTILTTNTHIPYISLLAKIPNLNLIVLSKRYEGRDWQLNYRNIPPNVLHLAIDNPQLNDFYLQITANCSKIILHCNSDLNLFCNTKSPLYSKLQSIPKYYLFHNSANTEFGNMPMQQRQQNIQQL